MDFLLVQFHFTTSLIKENQELAKLRDFLLPLLMNGQVGFKDNINEKLNIRKLKKESLAIFRNRQ